MTHSEPRKQPPKIDPDHIFEHFAECRYYIGDFFEQATANYFGAIRLSTLGETGTICPDHKLNETTFFECKSVGRNGNSILYASQLEKHTRFVQGEYSLLYVFWLHTLDVSTCISVSELHQGLARSLQRVIVVPLGTILDAVSGKQQRVLNYRGRIGIDGKWNREKECKGWQVRPKLLPKAPPMEAVPNVQVYGVTLGNFAIHTPYDFDDMMAAQQAAPF